MSATSARAAIGSARSVIRGLERSEGIVASSTVRFESTTVIKRPPEAVFERLADVSGYGEWMHHSGLFRRCGLTSESPVRAGTTYVDATRMGTFEGEVTEFSPPSRLAFRETLRWFGSRMSQASPEYFLEAEGTPRWSTTSPSGILRSDAPDEAGGSADGEVRTDPNSALAQAFAGVRVAETSVRRRASPCRPA